jgi:hypothetical protein
MFHPYEKEQLEIMYHDSLERIVLSLQEQLKDAEEIIWEAEYSRTFSFRTKLKEYRAKYGGGRVGV